MPKYADILLPLAQPTYTFAVEEGMELQEGMAVAVPFGLRGEKIYTGIVWRLHDTPPAVKRIKSVLRPLYGGRQLLTAAQQRFWEWVADYYLATLGEVMRIALPALMKPSTRDMEAFAEAEFRPRTERYLCPMIGGKVGVLSPEEQQQLDRLERRAPKQYEALVALLARREELQREWIPRRLLEAEAPILTALQHKGLIRICEQERSREQGSEAFLLPLLTEAQQRCLEQVRKGLAEKQTLLLHGVTGSGKTEIYIHLIAKVLAAGGDVLMLVPEIALTTQLVERLERIFSSRVTPYHSKLSAERRTDTYLRLSRSAGGEFVVGARSALFLPLKQLRLVIVDEEHDPSYKQSDPAPRYQARDCAVAATRLLGCRTLLGSATPSLESWTHAQTGKYGLAELNERYGGVELPEIHCSDTRRAVKRGERKSHFNLSLRERIEAVLQRGEQVILFQNRRGFSPFVQCGTCGESPRCRHCNVTLTYHKQSQSLTCHYCGYRIPLPTHCPACGAEGLQTAGFGTEKVAEEIEKLFPAARVLRMDRDTVNSESAFRRVVSAFERGEADILVGTQMITKGFDFGRVSLVGILNADNLLLNPDFRSSERAFQLMSQVAGRAGRRSTRGEVVIQTSDPDHPIIRRVLEGDYSGMARAELAEREAFRYPPYAHLIRLTLKHRDRDLLVRGATALGVALRDRFGRRVMGPVMPAVDRVREEWLAEVLLKIERGASMQRARMLLREELARFARKEYRTITTLCDVDPQ